MDAGRRVAQFRYGRLASDRGLPRLIRNPKRARRGQQVVSGGRPVNPALFANFRAQVDV